MSVDLSRYSLREINDELIRRLGVDEVCRLVGVASVEELHRLETMADAQQLGLTAQFEQHH
jgi:hypothetical protein